MPHLTRGPASTSGNAGIDGAYSFAQPGFFLARLIHGRSRWVFHFYINPSNSKEAPPPFSVGCCCSPRFGSRTEVRDHRHHGATQKVVHSRK